MSSSEVWQTVLLRQALLRRLPASLGAVKVVIKADQGQTVVRGKYLLVRVIEIQLVAIHRPNDPLCILGLEMHKRDRAVHEGVVDKVQQGLRLVEPAEDQGNAVEGKIGDEQALGGHSVEEASNFGGP